MRRILIGLILANAAIRAHAAPGLGAEVYPATIDVGATELESRYGRLTGGPSDGEDTLTLELSHGFSRRFYAAVLTELSRDPVGPRRLDSFGVEGIVTLGRIKPLALDVAAYVEYEHGYLGPDILETKALIEHRAGPFDGRLNLIANTPLNGHAVEFGYAASADWTIKGDLRGGFAAFGDAGDANHFAGRHDQFLGPVAKTDIDRLPIPGELEIEAGYLFALPGAARDRTDGQVRLLLSWERRF